MPGNIDFVSDTTYWGANLTAYVGNATIPESRLTDMAERIVAGWYMLDQDKNYPAGALDRGIEPVTGIKAYAGQELHQSLCISPRDINAIIIQSIK